LVALTSIIVVGIGAQWFAWRFKLPALLLLLIFGFIAGPVAEADNPDLVEAGERAVQPGQEFS
jgi:NhaP-type Na+/H+ or K+/H+ antiporter